MSKLKCSDSGYHEAVENLKEFLENTKELGPNIQLVRFGKIGSQAALVFGGEEPEHHLPISDLDPDIIRGFASNLFDLADAIEVVKEAERTGDDGPLKKYFFENTEPTDTLDQTVH